MMKRKISSLIHRVRVLVDDLILEKVVDKIRLRKIAKEIDEATQKYKTIPISSLLLKDVQKSLSLKSVGNNDEFLRVLPITPPTQMGINSGSWTTVSS